MNEQCLFQSALTVLPLSRSDRFWTLPGVGRPRAADRSLKKSLAANDSSVRVSLLAVRLHLAAKNENPALLSICFQSLLHHRSLLFPPSGSCSFPSEPLRCSTGRSLLPVRLFRYSRNRPLRILHVPYRCFCLSDLCSRSSFRSSPSILQCAVDTARCRQSPTVSQSGGSALWSR